MSESSTHRNNYLLSLNNQSYCFKYFLPVELLPQLSCTKQRSLFTFDFYFLLLFTQQNIKT